MTVVLTFFLSSKTFQFTMAKRPCKATRDIVVAFEEVLHGVEQGTGPHELLEDLMGVIENFEDDPASSGAKSTPAPKVATSTTTTTGATTAASTTTATGAAAASATTATTATTTAATTAMTQMETTDDRTARMAREQVSEYAIIPVARNSAAHLTVKGKAVFGPAQRLACAAVKQFYEDKITPVHGAHGELQDILDAPDGAPPASAIHPRLIDANREMVGVCAAFCLAREIALGTVHVGQAIDVSLVMRMANSIKTTVVTPPSVKTIMVKAMTSQVDQQQKAEALFGFGSSVGGGAPPLPPPPPPPPDGPAAP